MNTRVRGARSSYTRLGSIRLLLFKRHVIDFRSVIRRPTERKTSPDRSYEGYMFKSRRIHLAQ